MALLVVRHARAGKPSEWQGDDRFRTLDETGRHQAAGLPDVLARFEIARLVSSPHVRCTETLEPLSERLGRPVEESPQLAEGATRDEALALLGDLGDGAVACTHGDVLENLFGEAGEKGSTRVVELRDGEPVLLEYLPPPT